MNLPSNAELSLYRLTQEGTPPAPTLTVSSTTFRASIAAIVDFLIEQKIAATLWVKLPTTGRWLAEIERYSQQGQPEQIYLCTIGTIASQIPPVLSCAAEIVPLVLEASSQLKREYFLIVLSSQFCSSILAQRQTAQGLAEGTSPQSSRLKIVYSFEPAAIANVLAGIKQVLTVTDSTPESLLADTLISSALPTSIDSTLMTNLLLKQIQQSDATQFAKSEATIKSFTESLSFHHELLTNLTRELSLYLTNMKTALRLIDSTQNRREQRQRYLQLLQQQCDRQNSLLTGLLELEQFNQPIDDSESSLRLEDLIPGIVSIYQPIAEEKGIMLGYTVPADLPSVACPGNWLRQILRNLLSNSLKFTPANGRVYVQAALNNNVVELTVSDTGVGIDSNDIPKIFNSFYRGRNATSTETAGAGMGLTIVQQLLRRCHGSISVTSRLGRGSTFKVVLPVAA
ncbi:MAG: histidine kinase [Hydrococcus sp. C42_A2020_068]|nr:histidine kinase [Hydrococcus sp. C42_A2020_068]